MISYYFSPQVYYLLIQHDNGYVDMHYASNHSWPAPVIELRPPYYTNPQIVLNYPLI
ncbi:hypothetical protein [Paenibacillus sp. GCM10012306]|uniref:hypothetical protein n=1 Tax=Paenibacillus sp. GCM10012306 TaxID=3317342 RepID=UPI00361302C3